MCLGFRANNASIPPCSAPCRRAFECARAVPIPFCDVSNDAKRAELPFSREVRHDPVDCRIRSFLSLFQPSVKHSVVVRVAHVADRE